jgi:hypothetical protein
MEKNVFFLRWHANGVAEIVVVNFVQTNPFFNGYRWRLNASLALSTNRHMSFMLKERVTLTWILESC